MLDQHPAPNRRRRRSAQPPFPHILCAIDGSPGTEAAIEHAIAIADGDAQVVFAGSWYRTKPGKGDDPSEQDAAYRSVKAAVAKAREAGVDATYQLFHAPRLSDALLKAHALHDLLVIGAHPHARATGIVLGETATRLVHRSAIPVLVARARPLEAGVVVGTRAVPDDRRATTAAAHLAARLGAELTVVHVAGRDEHQWPELHAELANARALLGRGLDYLREYGSPAHALVTAAEGDGAGLIVVGSRGRSGLPALSSVSERVAHLAPCSVLVMRCRDGPGDRRAPRGAATGSSHATPFPHRVLSPRRACPRPARAARASPAARIRSHVAAGRIPRRRRESRSARRRPDP